jgi:hypothetical protein
LSKEDEEFYKKSPLKEDNFLNEEDLEETENKK